jgi:16S rRNA G966 N2-methylase RsmD
VSFDLINSRLEKWSENYDGENFHAVLCDPPYGLKFMGKDWDVVSACEWGEALLPHLHPGALVLMFGGTRTWHKLASGMEEAGFEMWDTLMWLYGQGFPKAQDISKLIDKKLGHPREVVGIAKGAGMSAKAPEGAGTFRDDNWQPAGPNLEVTAPGSAISAPWAGYKTPALKPAWEPILAFRKPSKQTYADLALEYGSGSLNIEGSRIGTSKDIPASPRRAAQNAAYGDLSKDPGTGDGWNPNIGRFPANLLLDETSATILDEQSGVTKTHRNEKPSDCSTEGDVFSGQTFQGNRPPRGYTDQGGASRFFYCAKASSKERNAGLEALDDKAFGMSNQAKAEIKRGTESFENSNYGVNSVRMVKNNHPTVKPIALTEYLAKLLLPPDSVKPRRILIPFAGSGSEMIGAARAGWDEIVGIEREAEYCEIAKYRLAGHIQRTNDN